MIPATPRFAAQCDKDFAVGETYTLVPYEERSANSHRHYFASIKEAWDNLPEIYAGRWPTPDHLRKWALVQAGYFVEKTIVAKTKADALRIAAFVQSLDEFAVVVVRDDVVAHYRAKSQSMSAMDRKEFQASKQAVLDVLDRLLGVEPGALARQVAPSIAPHREPERVG